MARIVGGIGSSHTPTIGFALDANKQTDPVWAPIFAGFVPVQQWLQEKRPDVLFFIYNDHVTSFFFDHYSHFALGVGEEYAVADEGGGPRHLPPVKGHPGLARHIALALTADEFDLAYFQGKPLDHGCFSPLSMMWPHEGHWPGAIVPLQVGVLEFPIPTARRCFRLGRSLRRAIESYPEDLRVAIVATGGLAHQVHGERAGFNNTPWDMEFRDLLAREAERLTELTIAQYAERGGLEGAEVIMWLIMRGALSARVKKLHSAYYLPSMTPIVTVIYEDDSPVAATETDAEFRERIARELAGVERLPGSYPFTLDRSVKTYRRSHFLHRQIEPQYRRRFLADAEPMYEEPSPTASEPDLVPPADWRGLIHCEVIFFLLEKLAAVLGITNLHVYAAMRGETLEEFQKTRNAQVLYSVAGQSEDTQR